MAQSIKKRKLLLGLTSATGGGYEPEALALFARFTTPATAARKTLINNFFRALKYSAQGNLLIKFDAIYLLAAETAQAARQNLIADLYNLTAVSSPTFTADRGYQGDGSAAHLTTGFIPSSAGGKLSLNSSHLSVWVNTEVAANTTAVGAFSGTNGNRIDPRRADLVTCAGEQNDTALFGGSVATAIGFTCAIRTGAGARSLRRNSSQLGADTQASSSLPTADFKLLQRGDGVLFSTVRDAALTFGSQLTSAESDILYNAENTYLTAVGGA